MRKPLGYWRGFRVAWRGRGEKRRGGAFKQPQPLGAEVPASLLLPGKRVRFKVSGDAGIGRSLQTPHPHVQFFSSTHCPYPERPKHNIKLGSRRVKGHGILAGQAGCPNRSQAPEWPLPPSSQLGTGRGPGPGLVCWVPAPGNHHPLLWPTDQIL